VSVGSGSTATVMVLVWTRPRFSLGGTRCQRWPPASSWNASSAPLPHTRKIRVPSLRSVSSRSKTPPRRALPVDPELVQDEELGVVAALGGADLDNHGHESLHRASPGVWGRQPAQRA